MGKQTLAVISNSFRQSSPLFMCCSRFAATSLLLSHLSRKAGIWRSGSPWSSAGEKVDRQGYNYVNVGVLGINSNIKVFTVEATLERQDTRNSRINIGTVCSLSLNVQKTDIKMSQICSFWCPNWLICVVRSWPSGKLPFDCQMAIFLEKKENFSQCFWK